MPSTSPGRPFLFAQILPGAPSESLQSVAIFSYQFNHYVAYISGCQLNVLSGPNTLVQSLTFNHALIAIAAEDTTGKIVVAAERDVWVLQAETEGWTRTWWERRLHLRREDGGDIAHCLDWGNEGEVLVGGSRALSLFSTLPSSRTNSPTITSIEGENIEERTSLWSKSLASPLLFARFSPSANLIATASRYATLVKIWRRLSFEEPLFDYTYLPHPGILTHLEWRPLPTSPTTIHRTSSHSSRHDDEPEILFTISSTGQLQIWRTASHHDLNIMKPHATLDLNAGIPTSPTLSHQNPSHHLPQQPPRYAFILPYDPFSTAATTALSIPQNDKVSHAREHLRELLAQEADLIVLLDASGRMSAWGIQTVGAKHGDSSRGVESAQREALAFHVAHVEGMALRSGREGPVGFCSWFEGERLNVVCHGLGDGGAGEVEWWRGGVEAFFSHSALAEERLELLGTWTGHGEEVVGLDVVGGGILVSRSSGRTVLWDAGEKGAVRQLSTITTTVDEVVVAVARDSSLILILQNGILTLIDDTGKELQRHDTAFKSQASSRSALYSGSDFAGLLTQDGSTEVIEWNVPSKRSASNGTRIVAAFKTYKLRSPSSTELKFVLPIISIASAKARVVGVYEDGSVSTAEMARKDGIDTTLESRHLVGPSPNGCNLAAANPSFIATAATDCRQFSITDLTDGYLEASVATKQTITNLACSDASEHTLAVAHPQHVDVYIRTRYHDSDSNEAACILVKSISIGSIGLTIAAVAWLADDRLTLALGNTVAIVSSEADSKALNEELKQVMQPEIAAGDTLTFGDLAAKLNEDLPIWHPYTLMHFIIHDQTALANQVLIELASNLKFWSEGDELRLPVESRLHKYLSSTSTSDSIDESTLKELSDQLEQRRLPRLTQQQQDRLHNIASALLYLRAHGTGLDTYAQTYLLTWRLLTLTNQTDPPTMPWHAITLAQQSTTQSPLLTHLLSTHPTPLPWPIARSLGLPYLLTDPTTLTALFDTLAQSAYRLTTPPDPVPASLFYLALNRKSTLLTLWRLASWHKEQRATSTFLKRDFGTVENRSAARKNGYALLGKRRFEYAAAFFLLADEPGSAAKVLAGQGGDLGLAVGVVRVAAACADNGDGEDGERRGREEIVALREVVEERVLPVAREIGDRWMACWGHLVLGDMEAAARVLVERDLDVGGRSWKADHPDTLALYAKIRGQGADKEVEQKAVARSLRVLKRMGLGKYADDLGKRIEKAKKRADVEAVAEVTTKMADVAVKDTQVNGAANYAAPEPVMDEKAAREAKAAELLARLKAKKAGINTDVKQDEQDKRPKPPPTQFVEPSANSLLDNFGF